MFWWNFFVGDHLTGADELTFNKADRCSNACIYLKTLNMADRGSYPCIYIWPVYINGGKINGDIIIIIIITNK